MRVRLQLMLIRLRDFSLAPVDGGVGIGVSGLGQCRVAAFSVCGLLRLANFFSTISHCAWRHVISLSKATKKRSKENAFRTRARKLTQRAVSKFLAPQKHGARKSHGCVNPSFSEHGYPHASPPVTEPAQGASRAIRVKPSTKFVRSVKSSTRLPPRAIMSQWSATRFSSIAKPGASSSCVRVLRYAPGCSPVTRLNACANADSD